GGGEIPVPAERLPVLLPEDVVMDGVASPLKADPEWRKATLDGQPVEHETDTFDTFMESSWYYARFTCPDFEDGMLDRERANYWLPVDQYIGGIEHAILHLLYARFFHKLMRDEGLIDAAIPEPFKHLLCQGMVLAETYYRDEENGGKRWYAPLDVDITRDDKGRVLSATLKSDGRPVVPGGMTKMSKSKNNGIDPQTIVDQYGADTVRLFMMFAAPPEQSLEWNDQGVEGANRFLRRLWKAVHQHVASGDAPALDPAALNDSEKALRRKTHETIQKVSDDYGRRLTFNTAIAAVMELSNELGKQDTARPQARAVEREALETAILLLAPIVPHITHALWHTLGHRDAVIDARWPALDSAALVRDSIQLAVQINGKVRAQIEVAANADHDAIVALALGHANVQKFIDGKTIKMTKVVPGKLVTIAVA
ncbi:MAG TPA: class I tRNA ligase family protein, partial [Spongiibacteraceae bacterium]|nr:class I tRNA ligase family protein [Spongiibacteraceae bacterium]